MVVAFILAFIRRQFKLEPARTARINMSGIAETRVTDTGTTSNLQNRPQVFAQPFEISALARTARINMSEIPETRVTDAGATSNLHDVPQVFAQPTEISSIADVPPPYNVAVQQQCPK